MGEEKRKSEKFPQGPNSGVPPVRRADNSSGLPLFSIPGYVLRSLCRELTRAPLPLGAEKNGEARGPRVREGEPD